MATTNPSTDLLLGILAAAIAIFLATVELLETELALPLLLIVLGLLLTIASLLVVRGIRRLRRAAAPLKLSASVDLLSQAWGPHEPQQRTRAALLHAGYALLTVRNEGETNLRDVVVRLEIPGRREGSGTWSASAGERFVRGGGHSADLNVGDTRTVIIALGLGKDELWAEVRPGSSPEDFPFTGELRRGAAAGEPLCLSPDGTGRRIDFGRDIELSVMFQAEGLKQRERIALSFRDGEPSAEVLRRSGGGRRRSETRETR